MLYEDVKKSEKLKSGDLEPIFFDIYFKCQKKNSKSSNVKILTLNVKKKVWSPARCHPALDFFSKLATEK